MAHYEGTLLSTRCCPEQVYSGGLSSYSIVNMLIGHLQREGHPAMHATASVHAAGAALPDERSLAASLTALLAQTSTAHSSMATDADLGSLLCAFFDLFGRNFSCAQILCCNTLPVTMMLVIAAAF